MTAVACAQLEAKQRDAAKDTVRAALEMIAPLPDEDAAAYFPMAELGALLAQAGDFPGALAVAESIGAPHSKVRILADLAAARSREGKRDEAGRAIHLALDAARGAPNEAIWSAAAHSGGAAKVPVDPMLVVRQDIARAQASIGDLDAAFEMLSRMGSAGFARFTKKNSVEQIVGLRLDAGDIAGARRAVDLITPSDVEFRDDRADFLERVAKRQARDHDPALSLDGARKETTPRAKLQVLRGLAEGIAERFDTKAKPSRPGDGEGRPQPRPSVP